MKEEMKEVEKALQEMKEAIKDSELVTGKVMKQMIDEIIETYQVALDAYEAKRTLIVRTYSMKYNTVGKS